MRLLEGKRKSVLTYWFALVISSSTLWAQVALRNGDFEDAGCCNVDWQTIQGVSLQGRVRHIGLRYADGKVLAVEPASSNGRTGTPFGVTQSLDPGPFQGATLYLSARLASIGAAKGAVVLRYVSPNGASHFVELASGRGDGYFELREHEVSIPDDIIRLSIDCVVRGTSGVAYFDDIVLSPDATLPTESPRPGGVSMFETLASSISPNAEPRRQHK